MTGELARLTWTDVVNGVAHEYGRYFTDYEATHLLWEYTGFPSFWTGDPVECATAQLHEYFKGAP